MSKTRLYLLAGGLQAAEMTGVTDVDEFLNAYREWMIEGGLAPNTVKQRLGFAASRLRAWGTFAVPAHEVVSWLTEHRGWTRSTYRAHLNSVYEFALHRGDVAAHPLARMRPSPAPRPRASPLTPAQRSAVFATASGDLLTWLMLGYYAGLRCHEIQKFHGRDLDEVHLRVLGKGQVDAVLPTHRELWRVAQQYPRDDYWFPSTHTKRLYVSESHIGNGIRAHFRGLGIERGSVHRLRHTYATELMRAGVHPRKIQILLRHASLATTEAYLGVDDVELAEAIELLQA